MWTRSNPIAPQIVIVGAGIGGLSAAIHLARSGCSVTVLEKNEQVGGKMGQVEQDGYRWDTGPSVITMRPVIEDIFHVTGYRMEDYVRLKPLEPLTRYFYPDGTVLDATQDWPRMAQQLTDLNPYDVEGYLRFLGYAARIHRITGPVFVYNRPPTWRTLMQAHPLDMARIQPWLTMDQAISRHVRSSHLRQMFGRFATYVGASPFRAPATLSVIADVELTGGVWYPRDGVYSLAVGFRNLAEKMGVNIQTNRSVSQIRIDQGRAEGVLLSTGEVLRADAVVANADVTYVYERLIPPAVLPPTVRGSAAKQERSCSGFAMLLGVDKVHPQLAHHNIFFSADYRQEFTDIFDKHMPPRSPTVYVAITAKTDPDHAPPGHENWFILVNVPPLSSYSNWDESASAYAAIILNRLSAFGLDIAPHIRSQRILSPHYVADRTAAWDGALYGLSSNHALNAFRRPHNRSPHVPGLYFAGGTTHPGGGVPMVALSGKVAASLIMEDLGG